MLRKLALVAAVVSGTFVLPALPTQAAPTGGCPYPPSRPVLALTVSPTTVVAGHGEVVFGQFSHNNCGIGHAAIAVQRRLIVDGSPSGSWTTIRHVTTSSKGIFVIARSSIHQEELRAVFTKAGAFPTTTSAAIPVSVLEHITAHVSTVAPCRVHISGSTYPAKAHRRVLIQNRGAEGHFHGWSNVWTATTNSHGDYSTTHRLTCNRTYNLSMWIGHDATDRGNRTNTWFGVKPSRHA